MNACFQFIYSYNADTMPRSCIEMPMLYQRTISLWCRILAMRSIFFSSSPFDSCPPFSSLFGEWPEFEKGKKGLVPGIADTVSGIFFPPTKDLGEAHLHKVRARLLMEVAQHLCLLATLLLSWSLR